MLTSCKGSVPHVNATLMKLVYTCDAASKMDTTGTIASFEDKEILLLKRKWIFNHNLLLPVILLDARKERTCYSMSMINFYLHTVCLYIIATHTHTRYKLTNYVHTHTYTHTHTHTQTHTHTRTHTHTSYIRTVHISSTYTSILKIINLKIK